MPNKLHPKQSRVTSWSQLRHWRWACASHMVGKPWRQRNDRGNICSKNSVTCMNEWPSLCLIIITAQGPSTASAHVSFSGFYSLYIQWCNETYKRNPLGWILINENGTFRYNTSAEHEGRARTIHTSGLKCKNKQKKTFTIYRWQGGDHYVQALHMQWRLARPKVYTQQCRTPLKATVIHFDNRRFFGKIKKLGAASTNTDENKKPTKVTHEIMNLVRFCTDAHSLHQFILSCCATPTGKGGEQKGEEFPLFT